MNLMLFCHTAVCRYSVEIAVGEESLCQKLFTLHLSFVNAYKQGIWRGEEFLATLHPLFTTLHLQKRKQRRKTDRWIANQPELKGEEW